MKIFKLVFTIIWIDILLLLVLKVLKKEDGYEGIGEDDDGYQYEEIHEILDWI